VLRAKAHVIARARGRMEAPEDVGISEMGVANLALRFASRRDLMNNVVETGRLMEQLADAAAIGPLDATITAAVGERLKAERQRSGVTLQELARRTHLSVAMLSKIENAQTSPSLRSLARLAKALDIHVGSFFSDFDQAEEPSCVRAGEGTELQPAETGGGLRYELLAGTHPARRLIQPFLISVPAPRPEFPSYQHPGSEFIFLLEGRMLFGFGRRTYDLDIGDSLLFNGVVPHGPKAVLVAPVKFLSVTSERLPGSLASDESHPHPVPGPHMSHSTPRQPG
jgi:transcriptional regulator with XRE-family HTH domain